MKDLLERSVVGYCDALASGEPIPGGGSAAALSGAHAAALLAMYCRLTIGRKKYAAVQAKMNQALEELERARRRLLELTALDAQAYAGVMEALALPRGTEDEKAARAKKREEAVMQATRVPLEVCIWAVRLLDVAHAVHRDGNPNALSDAGVGVQMAMAAFAGGALNVYINLDALADETFVVSSKKTVHDLESRARAVSVSVAADIYGRLRVDG